jgi:hypothetical protein
MNAYAPTDGRRIGFYVNDDMSQAQFFGYDANGSSMWLDLQRVGTSEQYDVTRPGAADHTGRNFSFGAVVGRATVMKDLEGGLMLAMTVKSNALNAVDFSPPAPEFFEIVADLYRVA